MAASLRTCGVRHIFMASPVSYTWLSTVFLCFYSKLSTKIAYKNIDFLIDDFSVHYPAFFCLLFKCIFGKRLRRKTAAFNAVHAIMYVVLL